MKKSLLIVATVATAILTSNISLAKEVKPYQQIATCKLDVVNGKDYLHDCKVRKNTKHNIQSRAIKNPIVKN